ncbi:unnamed protein product [Bursaphelenchus okinawaensis]|uniref:Large ribosomal subunit protein bL28m n=1 Tax=Bursaphelenchus okinawaensis TaxID=465554 RepID=A0A811KJM3_9BILA|nr:unnamed protein product [Bursaphelenchus okinawaensis]CAG9104664.1 unnamed protein product [Bursaphelenchus okinawaensis]
MTSLAKNLQVLTKLKPRPVITWDKAERIKRNQEIWKDPKSVVHRLPLHYQKRYWANILADQTPVHYEPPQSRYMWDSHRKVEVELQDYPIRPIRTVEQDKGLWGGEGVVKGYIESRPFVRKKILPRHWIPHWYFPNVTPKCLYSEVLDKYMKINVTSRSFDLINKAYGLDLYLLTTPEIDIDSKLGMKLKRHILIALAKEEYYPEDEEKHEYIKQKYSAYKIPLEEAEWVGLDLNEAARKQQDIEDNTASMPEKYILEQELLANLSAGRDLATEEQEYVPKKSKSMFGERLVGEYMKPIEEKVRRY